MRKSKREDTNSDGDDQVPLTGSIRAIGQVTPVLYCKQHPRVIVSGRHRLEAGARNTAAIDVERRAKSLGVTHKVAEKLLQFAANVQRRVSRQERREGVLELGRLLAEERAPNVIASVAAMLGVSTAYVYELAPELKDSRRAEAIKKGMRANVNRVDIPWTESESTNEANVDASTSDATNPVQTTPLDDNSAAARIETVKIDLPGNNRVVAISPLTQVYYALIVQQIRTYYPNFEVGSLSEFINEAVREWVESRGFHISIVQSRRKKLVIGGSQK